MNQHLPGQSTGIFVHCWKGDADLVRDNLPLLEHHQLPIFIQSPVDAPILEMGPHTCRTGGLNGYNNTAALDKQIEQFNIALEYDFDFYLYHDSDSFILEPELPQYLYDRKNEFFCNLVWDHRVGDTAYGPDYHRGMPPYAIQPPYFFSRETLMKLVDVAGRIQPDPVTPFVDWFLVQLCHEAKVPMARFHSCCSCDTREDFWFNFMACSVSVERASFLHGVKTATVRNRLVEIYNANKALK